MIRVTHRGLQVALFVMFVVALFSAFLANSLLTNQASQSTCVTLLPSLSYWPFRLITRRIFFYNGCPLELELLVREYSSSCSRVSTARAACESVQLELVASECSSSWSLASTA